MNLNVLLPLLVPMGAWEDFLGFLNTLMTPLYWAISGLLVLFHSFFSLFLDPNSGWSWALAIVLLTMLVRTALIPLFVRQINSTRNMQIIGPKVKELQEKYKDDRERLSQETMKLYSSEGINPMASCLPMLVQMPVFLSLFWVLNGAARGPALGYWLVQNPALVESLKNGEIFGAKISATFMPMEPWTAVQTVALVMVVLMVVTLFITQLQLMRKNMPPGAQTGPMAQQQKMMLFLFPLIYAAGGTAIPIGVLVYWLTTNLWTLCQQWVLVHNNPAPGTPAYVDWEDRMRAKGLDPDEIFAKRRAKQMGKKGRAAAQKEAERQAARDEAAKKWAEKTGNAGDGTKKQVVRRQQQRKTSRARRKSG
jgi:YidC/Oxa1 family membrane protein insertase